MAKKFKTLTAVLLTLALIFSITAWPVAANDGGAWAAKIATAEKMIGDGEFDGLSPAEMGNMLENLENLKAFAATEAGLLEALAAVRAGGADCAAIIQAAIDNPKPVTEGVFTCAVKSMMAKVGKQLQIPYEWTGAGAVVFVSSNPGVCGVSQNGILSPLKVGASVITVTAPNGARVVFAVTVSV